MKQLLLSLIVCASLCACHTSKTATQVVTNSVHDTLYLNKLQYDSIFIDNLHYIDRSADTILVKDKTVEYRYKLLRDTIYKSKVDSIPVIKEVTVTQEVERPLTFFDKLCRWCFYLLIAILFVRFVLFVVKNRTAILTFITKIL